MVYTPEKEIIEKYADVFVKCALNSGKGIKKGDVVYLQVSECARLLYVALRNSILKAGGTTITNYIPDDTAREYYELASEEQLRSFPKKYMRGLVDEIDHSIFIISETNKHELEGLDPKKIMTRSKALKPYKEWRDEKENKGKFSWTLGLYATPAMAKEAKLTLKQYWNEIIKACFLDEKDPILKWKEVFSEVERLRKKLNSLKIERLHVKGEGVDLIIGLGEGRNWLGGTGRNIPSFEVFISPDWRLTSGTIEFNQPLYRYGSLIEGIKLKFEKGLITKAIATKNEKLLAEMIATDDGSNKIGEYSLTDSRLSRITKFMAETLFDENIGGKYGNTHIAIGNAYQDSYPGNPSKVSKEKWKKLGYNKSIVHTDIITTTKRTVTATLANGVEKVIYKDGQFTI
ncbi:thermophilic metalloprotease (M29) superfamily [candidate division WWE3 bacterium RIFCSPHIGHO2_01_FULL_40_23]|uniref:Thermophilic metalloprotease (M29) superfamily n=1 Tax=candidate division WWE3 bacterium RIFCSPLOWO2_01_FULL_41_18 TaxID=1802625 RepID=A0A1F4VEC3_UNCKA|nr:MAG: thermophilic metalloprotease (M29) superfamily [candidate division WWE3 bacterium RIFCSPHIGHO2_01_FULL_40_23]OGC55053.1 MAG: thermophilic metalloprotease (M29) superfamily [candidate division WWE3 bacterium RIFCSPLOWO2_01_FULL_41_18]